MPAITNITKEWQSVTLAADELWVVTGEVYLSTDAVPTGEGVHLLWGHAAPFKAGQTVHYRLGVDLGCTKIERMAA